MTENSLKDKVNSLTQRLDHSVPDPKMSAIQNAEAAAELRSLSAALFEMLPDKALSPTERLERLARATDREPDMEQLKSAHQKVTELKDRINKLVPGEGSAHDKLVKLELLLNQKVGEQRANKSVVERLEILGDPRAGIDPI